MESTAVAIKDEPALPDTIAERKAQTDLTIEMATYWAKRLMEIVEKCGMSKNMSGKKYLEVEGWLMIAEFACVKAVVEWVRPWRDGFDDLIGYECRVRLLNKSGEEVGAGESSCGLDAFPCRGKQGSEKDKAAKSAAQTWATSRAIRNKFSYIAKMAGYQPVPAEEMTQDRPAPVATKPINYIQHLGDALLDYCNHDKKAAAEILKDLTGKTSLKDLSQTDACAAQLAFEKKYLQTVPEGRQPGEDDDIPY